MSQLGEHLECLMMISEALLELTTARINEALDLQNTRLRSKDTETLSLLVPTKQWHLQTRIVTAFAPIEELQASWQRLTQNSTPTISLRNHIYFNQRLPGQHSKPIVR